jgi:hypothetical protein
MPRLKQINFLYLQLITTIQIRSLYIKLYNDWPAINQLPIIGADEKPPKRQQSCITTYPTRGDEHGTT